MLQRCRDCGQVMWPVRPRCTRCFSAGVEWFEASGHGTVWSFAVVHLRSPGVESPYVFATVETAEGARVNTSIAGVDPTAVEIGMPVEASMESLAEDMVIPRFRAAA